MIMHPDKEGVAICSLTNAHIPREGFHEYDIDERNANALLIAAAPALFEACQILLEALSGDGSIDKRSRLICGPTYVKVLKTAIARVGGRK